MTAEIPPSEQAIMHEVTRTARAEFSDAILEHKAGGIWLEFIHMIDPAPRPIRSDFRFGDIGGKNHFRERGCPGGL